MHKYSYICLNIDKLSPRAINSLLKAMHMDFLVAHLRRKFPTDSRTNDQLAQLIREEYQLESA